MDFLISLYFFTTPVPGAAEAMSFIQEDVKVVIEFATNWSVQVALGITSIHAFIVLCKRFLGS